MQTGDDLDYWEHKIEEVIQDDRTLVETEKNAIIRARRGQGLFKERVMRIEDHCRVTVCPTRFISSPATANLGEIQRTRSASKARMAFY